MFSSLSYNFVGLDDWLQNHELKFIVNLYPHTKDTKLFGVNEVFILTLIITSERKKKF